jgi:hypothetical protein
MFHEYETDELIIQAKQLNVTSHSEQSQVSRCQLWRNIIYTTGDNYKTGNKIFCISV